MEASLADVHSGDVPLAKTPSKISPVAGFPYEADLFGWIHFAEAARTPPVCDLFGNTGSSVAKAPPIKG